MIKLALVTGIPMSEWAKWGNRAIRTAQELLGEAEEDAEDARRMAEANGGDG